MLDNIRKETEKDQVTLRLLKQVADAITRKFCAEGGILYAKNRRPYVALTGGIRKKLLKENHDSTWAGHLGQEWTLALLSRSFYWPRMENDVEQYVKNCLVCHQDETERRSKVSGAQAHS